MTTVNRDAEFATISNAAYSDNPPATIGNWVRQSVTPTSASGLFAVTYRNPITNQVVIAYRGTDKLFSGDGAADAAFLNGGTHPQFREAAELAKTTIENIHREVRVNSSSMPEIFVTGHSLGGGLAQLVGWIYGLNGATFDAPGAQRVINSQDFLPLVAPYLNERAGAVGASFINYIADRSLVSAVSEHVGEPIRLISLAEPGTLRAALTIFGIILTGGTGLIVAGATAGTVDGHSIDAIERSVDVLAGLTTALGVNGLQMREVIQSEVTGTYWSEPGPEPRVTAFVDGNGRVKAALERTREGWRAYTLAQSVKVNVKNRDVGKGQYPEGTIERVDQPTLSCMIDASDAVRVETRMSDQDNLVNADLNGDGTFDQAWIRHEGVNYDLADTQRRPRRRQPALAVRARWFHERQPVHATEPHHHQHPDYRSDAGRALSHPVRLVQPHRCLLRITHQPDRHLHLDCGAHTDSA